MKSPSYQPDIFLARRGKRAVFRETGFLIPVTIQEIHLESAFSVTLKAVDDIVLTSDRGKEVFFMGD
jgi:hypothetical protein